jgi:hypothetical protein
LYRFGTGEAHGALEYNEAIIRAWRETDVRQQEHPFFYDPAGSGCWRLRLDFAFSLSLLW